MLHIFLLSVPLALVSMAMVAKNFFMNRVPSVTVFWCRRLHGLGRCLAAIARSWRSRGVLTFADGPGSGWRRLGANVTSGALGVAGPVGGGQQWQSWIARVDVIACIEHILQRITDQHFFDVPAA